MPVPLTDSSEDVATYILDMITTAKGGYDTPVVDVWYGDQTMLPHTPAVCVMPGPKNREFQGASFRTLNTLETFVYVYFAVLQDVQTNLHGCTKLADQIETTIHSDLRLGGNVTACLCIQNEPGIINKRGMGLVMGARLLFRSTSKTMLPAQP